MWLLNIIFFISINIINKTNFSCQMKAQTVFLASLNILSILIRFASAQDPYIYPPYAIHQIVNVSPIVFPTAYVGFGNQNIMVRPYPATMVSSPNIPKVIVGIAGLQFTPTTSIYYRVYFSSTATDLTLKLGMTNPTFISMAKICYFAQRVMKQYFMQVRAATNTLDMSYYTQTINSWANVVGNKTYNFTYAVSTIGLDIKTPTKCFTTVLGIKAESIDLYQYTINCQQTINFAYTVSLFLYGNTKGINLFYDLIIIDKMNLEVVRATKVYFLGAFQVINGTLMSTIPTFDPTTNIAFFGMNMVTLKVGQLFTFQYSLTSNFVTLPITNRNTFTLLLLTTKTCTNPIQYVNRFNFQCAIKKFHNCTPQFLQINTNESIQVYQAKISKSKRYLVYCLDTKVNIYRFDNGVGNYVLYQEIFMSTNCRSLDVNEDFSILAVVGTNLFQVYTWNNDRYFQNFYTFPSILGTNYLNTKVSMTPDGIKVVITASTGGTVTGHYYFIYDKKSNEYIYKRFQASNALQAYFNKIGDRLYVSTTSKIIVYKQKDPNILGNYVIDYVLQTVNKQMTPAQAGLVSYALDCKVLAVYVYSHLVNYGIRIYHYDESLKKFVYHSNITQHYFYDRMSVMLRLSEDGLKLFAQAHTFNLVYYYTRPNLASSFTFQSTSDGDPASFSTQRNGFTISPDSDIITTVQYKNPTKFRLYTCGISVVQMVQPVNGKEAIYQQAEQYDIIINANSNQKKVEKLVDDMTVMKKDMEQQKSMEKAVLVFVIVLVGVIVVLGVLVMKSLAVGSSLRDAQNNPLQYKENQQLKKQDKRQKLEQYQASQPNIMSRIQSKQTMPRQQSMDSTLIYINSSLRPPIQSNNFVNNVSASYSTMQKSKKRRKINNTQQINYSIDDYIQQLQIGV